MSVLENPRVSFSMAADLIGSLFTGQVKSFYANEFTVGTAAGQFNKILAYDLATATGVPTDIDLRATTDPSGAAIVLTRLIGYMLVNRSIVVGEDLTIGGGANPVQAADVIPCQAKGGVLTRFNPDAATLVDATHKTLRVSAASGTGVLSTLLIFGRQ